MSDDSAIGRQRVKDQIVELTIANKSIPSTLIDEFAVGALEQGYPYGDEDEEDCIIEEWDVPQMDDGVHVVDLEGFVGEDRAAQLFDGAQETKEEYEILLRQWVKQTPENYHLDPEVFNIFGLKHSDGRSCYFATSGRSELPVGLRGEIVGFFNSRANARSYFRQEGTILHSDIENEQEVSRFIEYHLKKWELKRRGR